MIYLTPSAEKEIFSFESGVDILGVVFVKLKKKYVTRITTVSLFFPHQSRNRKNQCWRKNLIELLQLL